MREIKVLLIKQYRESDPRMRALAQVLVAFFLLWGMSEILIRYGVAS